MSSSKFFFYHQLVFLSIVAFACSLSENFLRPFSNLQVYGALILFFTLGIPHGALDLSLGKKILQPKFGSRWNLMFVLGYLFCVGLIILCWKQFPLLSFLFFLLISAFHFGFSDRSKRKGWMGTLEGLARGFLPISLPAYFYPHLFQELVESSLSTPQALLLLKIVQLFFYPDLILLFVLILEGFLRRDKYTLMNSLELTSLLALFLILKPFGAFLIYFCFLHSFRHILEVLEEMNLPLNGNSIKWLIVQALPATFITFLALTFCYLSFEHKAIDLQAMLNLFFISLAALTFPHMILVETIKKADHSQQQEYQ